MAKKPFERAIQNVDPNHLGKKALKRKAEIEKKKQAYQDRLAKALAKKKSKDDFDP